MCDRDTTFPRVIGVAKDGRRSGNGNRGRITNNVQSLLSLRNPGDPEAPIPRAGRPGLLPEFRLASHRPRADHPAVSGSWRSGMRSSAVGARPPLG